MAAIEAVSEGDKRAAAVKAVLFAYLDAKVEAGKLLDGIEEVRDLPLLCHVKPAHVPRHIWLYWHDGWESAPEIAKLCLRSWQLRNPGYEVHALDRSNVAQFLDRPPEHKGASALNGIANRVRLKLLKVHGGVWADATLFCLRPLDAWIHMLMPPARVFAFAVPGPERIVATWFLAALPRSPLVRAWEHLLSAYFETIEANGRRIHAYFVMAYILEYTLMKRPDLRALWDRVPKIPVTESGKAAHIALIDSAGNALDDAKRAAIAGALATNNMQKFTWKHAMSAGAPGAIQLLEILKENLEAG